MLEGNHRVAIAHDYLTQRGGAERVVLAMARAFPDAPIYTTLYEPETTFPEFRDLDIRTPWINNFSWARKYHRALLPVLPLVANSIEIDADIVLASSSGWSHGFRTNGRKIVYCYSPARWLYQSDTYLGDASRGLKEAALNAMMPRLRGWDQRAAATADRYLAISSVVRDRIADAYDREALVVPAPLTLGTGFVSQEQAPTAAVTSLGSSYFLCVARLLPYKNVDAVVRAFHGRRETLVVIGKGPELSKLQAMASDNVAFRSDLSDSDMVHAYRNCRAVIAASFEDYGLSPLEAAAAGKPAIVLRWGGFLDTVADGATGLFFDRPEVDPITDAVNRFLEIAWDGEEITRWSARFSEDRFAETLRSVAGFNTSGDEVMAAAGGLGMTSAPPVA